MSINTTPQLLLRSFNSCETLKRLVCYMFYGGARKERLEELYKKLVLDQLYKKLFKGQREWKTREREVRVKLREADSELNRKVELLEVIVLFLQASHYSSLPAPKYLLKYYSINFGAQYLKLDSSVWFDPKENRGSLIMFIAQESCAWRRAGFIARTVSKPDGTQECIPIFHTKDKKGQTINIQNGREAFKAFLPLDTLTIDMLCGDFVNIPAVIEKVELQIDKLFNESIRQAKVEK